MRRILLITLLISTIFTSVTAQKLAIGERAPDMKIKEWLSQKPTGDNAMLLVFYHSSCKQATTYLDNLDAIALNYAGRIDVVVVAKEAKEKVENIMYREGRRYYAGIDDGSKTFDGYGVQFVPFSVLQDQKGRVVWFGNSTSIDSEILNKVIK